MMRRTLTAAGLMTMMTILSLSSALAIDDGGGRSVFARGAGERALALGGAFAAVADDPGAMIWNPAGLGQLERKNLYASHSNLIGLGFSEQLGLLAIPHWKMGTFGLGLRRFGVDGIEGRDDRGTIFDDNLKDAETELILGYGRRLGNAWSLGMSFKYQQHELAGYSDGALGLDLGVMAKPLQAAGSKSDWADDLSLGLAIRNLIEPNLRLDEEGVKDPTGLRFGVALDRQLSENLQLLVTSDIEKTRDMDTHLHLGAELRVLRLLALRAGSNTGMLTAGLGVNYSNFVCDYAFEDNELEAVHRFGLGLTFGGTTTETRQANLAAQEAQLQKRLAQAFQRESLDRIQNMVAQARSAVDSGRFDEALRTIETCRVLDPGAVGIDALQAQAQLGRGVELQDQDELAAAAVAFQRCLAVEPDNAEAAQRLAAVSRASDQLAARSAELRAMLDVALAAYARGDLVKARDGFQDLLDENPDDSEARALLDNTLRTLSLQAGLLAEQARTQAKAGNLVSAKAKLDKAQLLDPGHPALDQVTKLVTELEREKAAAMTAARQQQSSDAAAPAQLDATPVALVGPSFANLTPKEQAEVADLYRRGLEASEDKRQDDAVRYWELVWSRAPDYQQVAENLKQEYLVQGMEAFASGQLEKSIEVWERADQVMPGDPRTQGYLARAYDHRSRIQQIRGEN